MEIIRRETMLLIAAMLITINQLFGGKDDALIAKLRPKMAEVKMLFQQGQAAFQENNLSDATDRFIDGYWKFRQVVWQCGYGMDAVETNKIGIDQPSSFPENERGCVPFSLFVELGCWLDNSLHHQKRPWFDSADKGFRVSDANSNRTKKRLVSSFKSSRIKCIRDCGIWLQNNYCKPVSECLLEHFKTLPEDAHTLINILELYKCYIECDCGYKTQYQFAQHNYNEVYSTFYPWFANIIKETLIASENSDMHTVLCSIFYNCDAKESQFTDSTSLPGEKIRGLGGYQIDTPKILKILQDPNFQSQTTDSGASQSAQLAEQIRACGTKWETYLEESRRLAHLEAMNRLAIAFRY